MPTAVLRRWMPMLGSWALACTPTPRTLAPPADAWGATSRCAVAHSRDTPLVVQWPAADRGSLEARLREGTVVVRWTGCEMEVLRRCRVPQSRYAWGGFTRKAETLRIRDADELYAKLPIGAARLEAKLAQVEALEVSMTLVGMYESDRDAIARAELVGDCDGATHVVSGVQAGAYALAAEHRAQHGGGVQAAGIGLGGSRERSREILALDGDPAACERAVPDDPAPPEGCGAPLRLEVVPLAEAITADVVVARACPPGFVDRDGACAPACATGEACLIEGRCPPGMSWIPEGSEVAPFCLDDVEVSAWAYAQCVDAGGCVDAATTAWWPEIDAVEQDAASELCTASDPARRDHPINCVTWSQARAYCAWRGADLPSDAQWRWAAAGGAQARRFPWGDDPPGPARVNACGEECRVWFRRRDHDRHRLAYAGDDGWPGTAIVGSFPSGASRWGPLDLAGNVAEWTLDSADDEQRRIVGGSFWTQRPAWLSTADTAVARTDRRDAIIGLRCAWSQP